MTPEEEASMQFWANLIVGQPQSIAFLHFQTHPFMLQSIRDKILL